MAVRSLTVAAALAAAVTVATPLWAADVDPKQLVLRQGEVPAGFLLDPQGSRYWSNTAFTRGRPAVRSVVIRSGRISGYQAIYNKQVDARLRTIVSSADLFRRANGARIFLSWIDQQQRKANAVRMKRGVQAYGRQRADVGAESWVYWSGVPENYILLIWRQGRVFASINSWGVGRKRTLVLAKIQQRRIVAALH